MGLSRSNLIRSHKTLRPWRIRENLLFLQHNFESSVQTHHEIHPTTTTTTPPPKKKKSISPKTVDRIVLTDEIQINLCIKFWGTGFRWNSKYSHSPQESHFVYYMWLRLCWEDAKIFSLNLSSLGGWEGRNPKNKNQGTLKHFQKCRPWMGANSDTGTWSIHLNFHPPLLKIQPSKSVYAAKREGMQMLSFYCISSHCTIT